jgi:ELWxxDGT repeat protein
MRFRFESALYFTVGSSNPNDTNQWFRLASIIGTPSPTLVANITPTRGSADQGDQFININGTIYLSASNASNGQELWKINAATGQSTLIEIVPGTTSSLVKHLTNVNGTLYFSAIASASDPNARLWRINPTTDAKELVSFSSTGQSTPVIKTLTNVNGILYFTVASGLADDRLWKIDAATGTPVPFGPTSSYGLTSVTPLVNRNGTYYFTAYAGNSNSSSLWKIDANSASPAIVTANLPEWGSSFTENLTYVNNKLYFTATVSGSGKELWTIDLATGVARMLEIVTGPTGSAPANLKNMNDTLYFTATTTNLGNELWTINSVTGNPVLVSDINLGAGSSAPNIIGAANDTIYLSATNGSNGQELWSLSLGNVAPIVANPIGSKTANEASLFTYQIPTTAFRDPNSGDVLTYSIRQSNGVGLPTWLSFNPQTRTLSGTPQTTTPLSLTVTATDAAGLSASDSFSLTITATRNLVTGTIGNDTLVGTNGADRLIATGATRTPGYGEIDTITGTGGADMFVLGSSRYVFYDDSLYANAGWWRFIQQRNATRDAGLGDYAFIKDFNPGEGDKIQLKGNASLYQLGASPIATKPGTAIFLIAGQQVAELIGVVQGTAPTSLTADYFSYV